MKEKKLNKVIITIIIIILIAIIVIEGYLLIQNKKSDNEKLNEISSQKSELNKLKENEIEEENDNEINETTKENEEEKVIPNNDTKAKDESKNIDYEENYSTYLGTWYDDNKDSELKILNISNNYLSFSWTIYRLASIDNAVVPIKNNSAVFYFQGYDDKNFNSKQDDGEHYYRKVTITLESNSIVVNVKDITSSEYNIEDEIQQTDGQVYIEEGTYSYKLV